MTCRSCGCANKSSKEMTGGSSDWLHSFHADTIFGGPRALSQATLKYIDQAPMFNPLQANTVIPTLPSVGIVPNAAYLGALTREAQQQSAKVNGNNAACSSCM